MLCKATASLSWLFETHSNGRTGHPSVAGSTMRRRSSISVGSRLDKARRPPPLRRTRPFGSGAASRSFTPRPMVERARPVISETASSPPHPAARTSPAANTRRPRSSSFEPTVSQRLRIAWQSIMPIRISPHRSARNPAAPSHIATCRLTQNRFICSGGYPNHEPDDQHDDQRRRDGPSRLIDHDPTLPHDLPIEETGIVPERHLLIVRNLDCSQTGAYRVEKGFRLRVLLQDAGLGERCLDVFGQMPASFVRLRTQSLQGPIEQ